MNARWGTWIAAALAFAGPLVGARDARADTESEESVRLVWIRGQMAERCQSSAELKKQVSARLGREVFSDAARRSIEGFVQREGDRWVAHIYARDADGRLTGSRDLGDNAVDCTGLDAAVTLAIALVIDPAAALRPPPANPASVSPPPPPPPPSPPQLPPIATPPPPSPPCPVQRPCPAPTPPASAALRDHSTISGRFILAGGVLPVPAAGFAVAADVPAYRGLHATAGAIFLPEVRTPTADFGFGLTAAFSGACFVPPWGGPRVALAVCGDLELGAIHSVVYAFEPAQPGDRVWAGAAADAEVRLRIVGPVALEAGAQLVVPFTRQHFAVEGQPGTAFQESAIGGVGFVGVGMSIP